MTVKPIAPQSAGSAAKKVRYPPWKLLVVDDDPGVQLITRLSLKGFVFAHREVKLYPARSAVEARKLLAEESGFAVALIDVVMETPDAGLRMVEHIRDELRDQRIRLVVRTAEPDQAPERITLEQYDIDDYKDKLELTGRKLCSTIRSALKSFRDLQVIDSNRSGLEMILSEMPELYRYPTGSMDQFFQDVFERILSLCQLSGEGCPEGGGWNGRGCIAVLEGGETVLRAGSREINDPDWWERLKPSLSDFIQSGQETDIMTRGRSFYAMQTDGQPFGCVYLEDDGVLGRDCRHLVHVLVKQCAAALESLNLRQELKRANESALHMLAIAAEFKDSDTGNHLQRLSRQTIEVSLEMGLSEETAEKYGRASMMHDIGKIGIPDALLLKPGKLTDDEFEVIKSHPGLGFSILQGSGTQQEDENFKLARDVALCHHEKWNGHGYPQGLKGEEIPLPARIVAVVDVFDALVSERPYKKGWPVEKALKIIEEGAGNHFDPTVAAAFLRIHSRRAEDRRKTDRGPDAPARRAVEKSGVDG